MFTKVSTTLLLGLGGPLSTAAAQSLGALPLWRAEGDQIGAGFGSAVARAGDVNGDGFDDVLVGTYRFEAGPRDEGRAFVYAGAPRRRLR